MIKYNFAVITLLALGSTSIHADAQQSRGQDSKTANPASGQVNKIVTPKQDTLNSLPATNPAKPAPQRTPLTTPSTQVPANPEGEVAPLPGTQQPLGAVDTPQSPSCCLWLNDKLSLAMGIGVGSTSGAGEAWRSGWHGQLFAEYVLPYSFAQLITSASFRYTGLDVSPTIGGASYRGIVEGYMFGYNAIGTINTQSSWSAGAELGLQNYSLQATDVTDQVLDVQPLSAAVGIYGRFLYSLLDSKFKLGPQLRLSFGQTTTYEFSTFLQFGF